MCSDALSVGIREASRLGRPFFDLRSIAAAGPLCAGVAIASAASSGCAPSRPGGLPPVGETRLSRGYDVGECGPEDQRSSYQPPVRAAGRAIRVEVAGAGASVIPSVERALAEWSSVRGHGLLGEGLRLEPVEGGVPETTSLDCGSFEAQADVIRMQFTSDPDRWSAMGLQQNTPGVTLRCYLGGALRKQLLAVNPTLAHEVQVASVVLHELGHGLGLEHSCDDLNRGSASFRPCREIDPGHAYRLAVMFPFLRKEVDPGRSEVKETLRENDRERINCLYR